MKGDHDRRHCLRVRGGQIMKILVKQACCACEVLSEKFFFLCFDLISSCLSESFSTNQPDRLRICFVLAFDLETSKIKSSPFN